MHEPGDLVWAKMKGYPPWPAMVMDDADVPVETPSGKHPVLFFGTNETGFMKTSELFPYLKHRRAYEKTRRVKGFRKAVQEIRREAGLDASNLPKESESMEEMDFAKALGKSRFATKAQTGGTKGKAAQDTATSSKASESPRKRRLSNRAAAEQTPLSLKRSRQPSEVKMEPEEPLPVNFDISVDSSTEGSRHEEEERAALLVEYQQSIQAAAKASKPKRPKTKLKVAIRKSKPTKACPAAAPRVPEPENIHGNLQECGACGSGVRPETGGAVGCYRLRCSNKSCRKWWGVVDRDKWMEEMNYVPKRMKDIDQLRASAAKKSFSPLGSRSGEGVLDLEKELADFDPVAADDALEGLGDILGLEDSVMQSPEGRKTKRVSFEPLKHEDLELTECGVCGQEGSSCPCSGWDSGARPGPSALRGTKRTAPRRKGSSAKGPKTKVPRRAPTVTDSVDETVTVIASGRSWGGDSETEGEARSSPLDTSSRGIVETKSRWWLRSRGMSREMSPPRALTTTPMDAAAVFRIIGGSLESLGERLRSAPDESPGAVAGTLDLLLDSLMASLPPLLSLAGMVDGIPALPAERLAELEERTTPLIPMFNQFVQTMFDRPQLELIGTVHCITTLSDCQSACDFIRNATETEPIGLDCEWEVVRGRGPKTVSLVQLCLQRPQGIYYHYPFHLTELGGLPTPLKQVLMSKRLVKVGLNVEADVWKLGRDWGLPAQVLVRDSHLVDVGNLANSQLNVNERWSLDGLLRNQLGLCLDKDESIRCGKWESHPLSETQKRYAALDTYASLLLYEKLKSTPRPPTASLPI